MRQIKRKSHRDKKIIEAVVRRFGPLSRVNIHEVTGLRRSTISSLVRGLLEDRKLLETGLSNNPMGRKQVLLSLNPDYGFVVALEFDDQAVVAAILDLSPRVRHLAQESVDLEHGVDGLVKQLQGCARRAIQEAGLAGRSPLGIGIADPGLVDSRQGTTLTCSTISFWKQVPLGRLFEQEFQVPVIVESKTRAKAIAERILGAGGAANDMIYVDYGTGIGAGIIVDGKVLYGRDCGVGEFGHTHNTDGKSACKCGSIGCLEALAGCAAIESKIHVALAEGAESEAADLARTDGSTITAWHVLQAAHRGDKISVNIVAEVSRYLGLGISNLVNLFNPSVVVLDHRLEVAGDGLLSQIWQIIRRQALRCSVDHLMFRYGTLGNEAGVLGTALVVLDKYFEIPTMTPARFKARPMPSAGSNPPQVPALQGQG